MTDNEHDGMKKCPKCGEWKPSTAEYFSRDKTMTCGIRSKCKVCRSEYKREYRKKNKDMTLEYQREYYQKNKDRLLEYRKKNKDRNREYNREYYQKNRDRKREYSREYEQSPVGKLSISVRHLRKKTGATIYVRDMTEEQKETLANQRIAVKTLEKTEKELLAASGKKRCSMCGRVLDCEMFRKQRAMCRACYNERMRKYRQNEKNKKKHLTKQNPSPITRCR